MHRIFREFADFYTDGILKASPLVVIKLSFYLEFSHKFQFRLEGHIFLLQCLRFYQDKTHQ